MTSRRMGENRGKGIAAEYLALVPDDANQWEGAGPFLCCFGQRPGRCKARGGCAEFVSGPLFQALVDAMCDTARSVSGLGPGSQYLGLMTGRGCPESRGGTLASRFAESRPIVTFRLAAQHALPVANLTNDQVLRMLGQASRVPRIWKTKRSGSTGDGHKPWRRRPQRNVDGSHEHQGDWQRLFDWS